MISTRLALRLYRCLLAFYPRDYRADFAEEMEIVFYRALAERHVPPINLVWRELRDWPILVWRAHCDVRRKKMIATNSSEQPQPVSQPVPAGKWRDAGLAVLAFLFYLWIPMLYWLIRSWNESMVYSKLAQSFLVRLIPITILVFNFTIVLLCWRGGWPRWSSP